MEHQVNHAPMDNEDKIKKWIPKVLEDFLQKKQVVIRFVKDAIAGAVDQQKENADRFGRRHIEVFDVGDRVLLSTGNLPVSAVSNLGSSKLTPRFIGPFKVLAKKDNSYTLDIPKKMRLHPVFYVGRLNPFVFRIRQKVANCAHMRFLA